MKAHSPFLLSFLVLLILFPSYLSQSCVSDAGLDPSGSNHWNQTDGTPIGGDYGYVQRAQYLYESHYVWTVGSPGYCVTKATGSVTHWGVASTCHGGIALYRPTVSDTPLTSGVSMDLFFNSTCSMTGSPWSLSVASDTCTNLTNIKVPISWTWSDLTFMSVWGIKAVDGECGFGSKNLSSNYIAFEKAPFSAPRYEFPQYTDNFEGLQSSCTDLDILRNWGRGLPNGFYIPVVSSYTATQNYSEAPYNTLDHVAFKPQFNAFRVTYGAGYNAPGSLHDFYDLVSTEITVDKCCPNCRSNETEQCSCSGSSCSCNCGADPQYNCAVDGNCGSQNGSYALYLPDHANVDEATIVAIKQHGFDTGGEFSAEFWIKPDINQRSNGIIFVAYDNTTFNDTILIQRDSLSNKIKATIQVVGQPDLSCSYIQDAPWGSWFHVAISYRKSTGYLYMFLNGEYNGRCYAGAPNTNLVAGGSWGFIGGRINGSSVGGRFAISEFRYYGIGRSTMDIWNSYRRIIFPAELPIAGLVAYYRFDSNAVDGFFADSSDSGADGHIQINPSATVAYSYVETNPGVDSFDVIYPCYFSSNPSTDCGGHGSRSANGSRCVCDGGWSGAECTVQLCPSNCNALTQHKMCEAGVCKTRPYWAGAPSNGGGTDSGNESVPTIAPKTIETDWGTILGAIGGAFCGLGFLFFISKKRKQRNQKKRTEQLSRQLQIEDRTGSIRSQNSGMTLRTNQLRFGSLSSVASGAYAAQTGCSEAPLRLLSLDGGGMRGLVSIEILKFIQFHIGGDESQSNEYATEAERPSIQKCFDFISGTSAGGIVAIALVTKNSKEQFWPLTEIMTLFFKLGLKVFSKKPTLPGVQMLLQRSLYSGKLLESVLQSVFGANTENLKPDPADEPLTPKMFVVSCLSSLDPPIHYLMRNYDYSPGVDPKFQGTSDFTIAQAARCTSAAPSFFPPVHVGALSLSDGSVMGNNPTKLMLSEAKYVFNMNRPIACIVSVGTGYTQIKATGEKTKSLSGWIKSFISIATSSESIHQDVAELYSEETYFRFNPTLDVREYPIDVSDASKLRSMIERTRQYMGQPTQQDQLSRLAYLLVDPYSALEKQPQGQPSFGSQPSSNIPGTLRSNHSGSQNFSATPSIMSGYSQHSNGYAPGMMQQQPGMMQPQPGMMQHHPGMMQQQPGMMQPHPGSFAPPPVPQRDDVPPPPPPTRDDLPPPIPTRD